MYAVHPAERVLAFDSTKRPLMPKSHSFILPFVSTKILDGLTSRWITPCTFLRYESAFTVYLKRNVLKRND